MEQAIECVKSLQDLLQRDKRYPLAAYGFMLSALHVTISALDRPRHVCGRELADGFRHLALEQFGPMTRTVLEAWNLKSTEDLGAVVFNLIDVGLLSKSPEDRLEDFCQLYNFEQVFGSPYPYLSA